MGACVNDRLWHRQGLLSQVVQWNSTARAGVAHGLIVQPMGSGSFWAGTIIAAVWSASHFLPLLTFVVRIDARPDPHLGRYTNERPQ